MLGVEAVEAGYTDTPILRGISLHVARGEIVCIIGPNGSGKSTLLRTIVGALRPRRGRITLEGRPISGLDPHVIVRCGLTCVPQGRTAFTGMTVRENLEVGGYLLAAPVRRARVTDVLAQFPALAGRHEERAGLLSGGQQQMVEMARALVLDPKVLLLDEPTLGLSPGMAGTVLAQVQALRAAGRTVLIVEQNAKRALEIADRGYVLDAGQTRFEDTGQDLLRNDEVKRLYLGVA